MEVIAQRQKTVIVLLSCVYISNSPWPSPTHEILLGTLGHDHGGPTIYVLTMYVCSSSKSDFQMDMTIDQRRGCGNSGQA